MSARHSSNYQRSTEAFTAVFLALPTSITAAFTLSFQPAITGSPQPLGPSSTPLQRLLNTGPYTCHHFRALERVEDKVELVCDQLLCFLYRSQLLTDTGDLLRLCACNTEQRNMVHWRKVTVSQCAGFFMGPHSLYLTNDNVNAVIILCSVGTIYFRKGPLFGRPSPNTKGPGAVNVTPLKLHLLCLPYAQ